MTYNVSDAAGNDASEVTRTVMVVNTPPTNIVLSLNASSINEDGTVTLQGAFTDPSPGEAHQVTIVWGDGSLDTVFILGAGDFDFGVPHQYLDDNPTGTSSDNYDISVTVADTYGGPAPRSDTKMTKVTVNNVAPTVSAISGPVDPIQVGTPFNAGATFTDPGTFDTHTAVYDWGDDITTLGTVVQGAGVGSVAGSYAYDTPGVYTITLTVTDDDGGVVESIYQFVVVYDPSAGFVTGGGFIDSPAGAYPADPGLIGKANFGFVSKYKKGATVPTGQTEFQFHVASFNFHSSLYEWLVVAGAKAQFKGTGTVNGQYGSQGTNGYGFLLTATDGDTKNGGDGIDKFRIKIVDRDTDTVVYDNNLDTPEDIDAADPQAISGGSIVVHTAKGKK